MPSNPNGGGGGGGGSCGSGGGGAGEVWLLAPKKEASPISCDSRTPEEAQSVASVPRPQTLVMPPEWVSVMKALP